MTQLQTIDLSGLLDSWLATVSPSTVRLYRGDLARFSAYINGEDPARFLSNLEVGQMNSLALQWRRSMEVEELAPSTINRRLSALRSFTKLGHQVGLFKAPVSVSGVRAMNVRDVTGTPMKVFTEAIEELRSIGKLRSVVAAYLMHDSALRLKEVADIQYPAQVNLKERFVVVKRKAQSGYSRKSISARTVEAIRAWIEARGETAGYLLSQEKSPLRGLAHGTIRKQLKRFGLSPQRLRHLAITMAAEKSNGNVLAVQAFAGHKNVATTQRYIDDLNRIQQERELTDLIAV